MKYVAQGEKFSDGVVHGGTGPGIQLSGWSFHCEFHANEIELPIVLGPGTRVYKPDGSQEVHVTEMALRELVSKENK